MTRLLTYDEEKLVDFLVELDLEDIDPDEFERIQQQLEGCSEERLRHAMKVLAGMCKNLLRVAEVTENKIEEMVAIAVKAETENIDQKYRNDMNDLITERDEAVRKLHGLTPLRRKGEMEAYK